MKLLDWSYSKVTGKIMGCVIDVDRDPEYYMAVETTLTTECPFLKVYED